MLTKEPEMEVLLFSEKAEGARQRSWSVYHQLTGQGRYTMEDVSKAKPALLHLFFLPKYF